MIFFPILGIGFGLKKSTISAQKVRFACYSWSQCSKRFGRAQSYNKLEGICNSFCRATKGLKTFRCMALWW